MFAQLLRTHRGRVRLTQEELAERARLSVRTLRDLERGRTRYPHRTSVRRLATALELTGEDRLTFEAAPQPRPLAPLPGMTGPPSGASARLSAAPAVPPCGERDVLVFPERVVPFPERGLSPDRGSFPDRGPFSERGLSPERGPSSERGFSLERGSLPDRGLSPERGPSPEHAPFPGRGLFAERLPAPGRSRAPGRTPAQERAPFPERVPFPGRVPAGRAEEWALPAVSDSVALSRLPLLREIEDAVMIASCSGRPTVVTVTGPAGTGKTTLATQCAHVLRQRMGLDALFVDLGRDRRDPRELRAALRLARLGLAASPASGGRCLLLADDADGRWDGSATGRVQPLLALGFTGIIVTGREPIAGLVPSRHLVLTHPG
ncbi:hypothetical protein GCM10017559_06200 [Streptosporangium longisporum]|uniref:HTH cro/C1-type domain-containing protein n=1 Tax=Streptosporangium longisporum TaxID=46187 RepID=A0ABN3XR28_9ACTN